MLFLEEIWSRNFTNLFIAPMKIGEILTSLVITALIWSLIGLVPAILLTSPLFGISILDLGIFFEAKIESEPHEGDNWLLIICLGCQNIKELNETILNKDEEIKQLTDQMGILGDTLNQKQELIEITNKEIN